MQQDLLIIRNQLHCNAINIYGTDLQRLIECAETALKSGLHVWLQPRLVDVRPKELREYLSKAAKAAEQLRIQYDKVIFNVGCELSIFSSGIVPGRVFSQRAVMLSILWCLIPYYNMKLNSLLRQMTSAVREHFHGAVTYGAGAWETVDWKVFDIVGVNHYMDAANKGSYTEDLRKFYKFNKPVAITEFGCCCFEGAEDKGGGGFQIINWKKPKPQIKGSYIRNEEVQAQYIANLIEIYERENIYGAFIFTYMEPTNLYSPDPRYDLDMASYGVVTAYPKETDLEAPKLPFRPKKAFEEIARLYGSK